MVDTPYNPVTFFIQTLSLKIASLLYQGRFFITFKAEISGRHKMTWYQVLLEVFPSSGNCSLETWQQYERRADPYAVWLSAFNMFRNKLPGLCRGLLLLFLTNEVFAHCCFLCAYYQLQSHWRPCLFNFTKVHAFFLVTLWIPFSLSDTSDSTFCLINLFRQHVQFPLNFPDFLVSILKHFQVLSLQFELSFQNSNFCLKQLCISKLFDDQPPLQLQQKTITFVKFWNKWIWHDWKKVH